MRRAERGVGGEEEEEEEGGAGLRRWGEGSGEERSRNKTIFDRWGVSSLGFVEEEENLHC